MNKMNELALTQLKGVHLKDIPFVEDLLLLHIFFSDINFVEGKNINELDCPSVQKYENTVRLLRNSYHKRYVSNINAVFPCYCCSICNTFYWEHPAWTAT